MSSEPTPDDVLAFVRGLMHLPPVKAMVDLDTWGKEKGLDSGRRAALISAIFGLVTSTGDTDAANEYVKRAVEVMVALVPALRALGSQKDT